MENDTYFCTSCGEYHDLPNNQREATSQEDMMWMIEYAPDQLLWDSVEKGNEC